MFDKSPSQILDYHRSMLADAERTLSLERAIRATVEPGDTVLDLGCGSGILTCFACRAGARRVYALEAGPVIELAKTLCRTNGFGDRVVFLQDMSFQARLPEAVDLILTETIGNLGLEEGILGWVSDARRRFLRPGGKVIPQAIELIAAPVELPAVYRGIAAWEGLPYGLDFSPGRRLAANNPVWTEIGPADLLGTPATLGRIVLAATERDGFEGQAHIRVARNGTCHGVGGWFNAQLTDSVSLSNAPPLATPSWGHGFLPLEQPLEVEAGEVLYVKLCTYANGSQWRWGISRATGNLADAKSRPPPALQSTLAGRFLSMEGLRKGAEGYVPQLTREGEVRLFVLERMAGSLSVRDIADEAEARFPDFFAHPDYALDLVRKLSREYG